MPTYGPNSAGAGATADRGGSSGAWTTPSNITVSDTNYARNDDPDPYTDYLDATSFGFSIPAGETVVGVYAEIERMEGSSIYNILDETVQLLDAGSPVGNNKADTVTEWPTAFAYAGYGGAADTWGYGSWTPAKINASNFGLRVAASGTAAAGAVRVDHIRITVYTAITIQEADVLSNLPDTVSLVRELYRALAPTPFLADIFLTQVFGNKELDLADAATALLDTATADILKWVNVDLGDQLFLADSQSVSGVLLINANPTQQIYRPRMLVSLSIAGSTKRYSTEDLDA